MATLSSSQSTPPDRNSEARDSLTYVEIDGLAAGAIYNEPPPGRPKYQDVTATLVVPSVSSPAGAVINEIYKTYFWVSLGTASVLQAGVIATTVNNDSKTTTDYSAAWSWADEQYQIRFSNGRMADLGINPSSIIQIAVRFVGVIFLKVFGGPIPV